MRRFAENSLVKLVRHPAISEEEKTRILGCLQPWSDTFQRVIALRVACESDRSLQALAQQHLAEEVNHNTLLAQMQSGEDGSGFWDPVVSAAASWFVDQMLTLPGLGRAVLAHLVLEGSGLVVLQAGCTAYRTVSISRCTARLTRSTWRWATGRLRNGPMSGRLTRCCNCLTEAGR